ncbi:MAG TPA: error-prone DNA polymerase [Micropepsaceae bacterium]|nr:error-prone DNA polymerase [Micropepsaceae bacterium]
MSSYAELAVTSNFSFLRGGSHPEELAVQAKSLGHCAFGLADRNSVAGLVRAHSVAKEHELQFLPGVRLVFADGTPDILSYPHCLAGWSNLTRLLTRGKRRAEKGACALFLADLLDYAKGLHLIVMPPSPTLSLREGRNFERRREISGRGDVEKNPLPESVVALPPSLSELRRTKRAPPHSTLPQGEGGKSIVDVIRCLREAAGTKLWLAASMLYRGDDARRLERLGALAAEAKVPLIATNDVLYHHPDRRPLQDVVTCIREHLTLDAAGKRLAANAERHLKSPEEMLRLFRRHPEAVEETEAFAQACRFSLDELRPSYPLETREGFATPQDALAAFAEEGARKRYPETIPDKIRHALAYELKLVAELHYAPYFLTVHDIVRFAKSQGILCQGRGSAANSSLCYCLGITEVDPMMTELLFERFISADRNEPPDIDIDFEHERREEVLQYVYGKYGRERAALTATTICYRGRSAIREVGKVFGLSEDVTASLARTLWGWSPSGVAERDAKSVGLDPKEPRLARVLALADELIDFPRHLSQHVGGFVITEGRLDEIVPIENAAMDERTVIEWNKDDIDALKILKVDLLGLGMLSCLRRGYGLVERHYGQPLSTASMPKEEKPVYDMLSRADSIGVFQVESWAQMSMLPRLKPKEFYDLVIEVAIVRPGPIQGDMVHPYLRRREGKEPVTYYAPAPEHGPPDELKKVMEKTLGVPLFQEQAMRVAIEAAKFAPAEADRLRRAMATFRRVGTIQTFREKFVNNMSARGYPREFAEGCFRQIEGFGEYGFPESHAASFALLVYASAWIKCHYPDVFAAALLNSQPMGFYAPAQIVRDAADHGVEIRPVDVGFSDWDCTLEPGTPAALEVHIRHAAMEKDIRTHHAMRLGFRQIVGFSENDAKTIMAARTSGFSSLRDFWLRTGLSPAVLRRLAEADAFGSLGLNRREALWALRALRRTGDKDDLPLFARAELPDREPDAGLPSMPPGEQVIEDYRHLQLSVKAHPLAFLRETLAAKRILRCEQLPEMASGRRVTVAGLVLVRQRPGSAQSIFMTVEDETGIANIIVWPPVFEKFRGIVMGARLVAATGKVQNESKVVHILAERLDDLTPLLELLSNEEVPGSQTQPRFTLPSDAARVMPGGRNFH